MVEKQKIGKLKYLSKSLKKIMTNNGGGIEVKDGEEKKKNRERQKDKENKVMRSDVGNLKRRSIEISLLKSDLLRTHTNHNIDPYVRALTRTYILLHIYTYIHIHTYRNKHTSVSLLRTTNTYTSHARTQLR